MQLARPRTPLRLRAASIGRVELYLLSHDPAERVDLSATRPEVVAMLLPELQRLLRETARDGPDVLRHGV